MNTTQQQEEEDGHSHSNDDCTTHCLTGVPNGSLLQVKKSFLFFVKEKSVIADHKQPFSVLDIKSTQKDDILILLKQSGPHSGSDEFFYSSCYAWDFLLYHKDHGTGWFYWDMRIDDVVDLDVYLEVVGPSKKKQNNVFSNPTKNI